MPMRTLEDLTATDFAAAGSPDGRAWMAALPALSGHLARQWDLTFTGEQFRHGYNAVVVFAARGGRPLALKLTWPPDQAQGEADALTAWRARGVVELVAFDLPRGALLLERLDASRSLASLPLAEAAAAAGALVRTLAIEASGPFPSLQAAARQLAATFQARQRSLRDPVPGQWVTLAARLAADLARDPARCLVHTDLHYDNILASGRRGQPWAAIDPRAAVGAPERSVAELLWTRGRRASRPVRHHQPARHARRPRPTRPGQDSRVEFRADHRLLAVGTGKRAHQRPPPVPADSGHAGASRRANQPCRISTEEPRPASRAPAPIGCALQPRTGQP
jgi:streptomycin 6-kinase